jgi:cytoskeletal protein CcmA (bactofilin family)
MLGRKDRADFAIEPQFVAGPQSKEAPRMMDDKDLGTKQPNTFIGKGSEFVGKLTFDGTVRIDGKVDGEIFSRGTLNVGPGADVSCKIQVDTVILSGTVRGNISAAKKIEMRAPGKLYGNIKTPTLMVEEGVIFEGNCKMEALEGEKATPELKLRQSEPRISSPEKDED